jgi:hypothetical protein
VTRRHFALAAAALALALPATAPAVGPPVADDGQARGAAARDQGQQGTNRGGQGSGGFQSLGSSIDLLMQ